MVCGKCMGEMLEVLLISRPLLLIMVGPLISWRSVFVAF